MLKRIALRVAVVLAVLLGLSWAGHALWKRSLDERFEAELAALRREGVPLDIGPLARREVPPDRDALPLLKEGERLAQESPLALLELKDFDEFDDEEWEELAAWLDRQAAARSAFTRAATMPDCSWIYDESEPPFAWSIEVSPFQEATELFEAEGRLMLRNGASTAEVLGMADRIFGLRCHLDDRFAIGWVVRRTLERVAVELVRGVAARPSTDLEAVRTWVESRAGESTVRPVADVLRHERAFGLANLAPRYGGSARTIDRLEAIYAELAETTHGAVSFEIPMKPGVSLLLHSPAGPALDRRIALSWLDADARTIAACGVVNAGTPAAVRDALSGIRRLWFDPFGSSTSGPARMLPEELLARRARFAITRAGLAALGWRREHGDWPDACEGVDPFTDAPLRYERTAAGVRISAAAPDRFDDLAWLLRGP